jgi:hexosaminidase
MISAKALGLLAARALLLLLLGASGCARTAAPVTSPRSPGGAGAAASLVPRPLSVEPQTGHFAFSAATPIYWRGGRHYEAIARFLSGFIGTALGAEPLAVKEATGDVPDGSILVTYGAATPALAEDGYELSVRPAGIVVRGTNSSGAFYAVQTLRQLLPAALEYEAVRAPRLGDPPPVQVPAIVIRDEPRYPWRGAMLDVSRHFLSVDEVKRFIDLMALHKLNRLHLHLTDDQGWRIEIKSWPELARRGGSTEVGGGPGGYYTQEQYADIVAYALARYVVVVPEIDLPGHTNAALASYAELNCDGRARPPYTGVEVGFSALCVEKDVTYRFIDDVVREIGAMTPGPYFHVGGDEVKTLTAEQYTAFIDRVQSMVVSHGKQVIGWDEIASAWSGSSIVQHWRPKATPRGAVAKGAKVIVSVANKVYLDMKYDANTPIGLQWAGLIDLETSYGWDPAEALEGVPDTAILGVEAPLWSETVATINDVEFLAFPRLAAIAEVAWTRQADRGWENFRQRLAAQGARWTALGLNFYRDPGVPWR